MTLKIGRGVRLTNPPTTLEELPRYLDNLIRDLENILNNPLNEVPEGGTTGQVLSKNTSENQDLIWVNSPKFLTYVKPEDTTKNSDVVFADDPHLVTETLEANSFYRVEFLLMTKSGAATDLSFRVSRTGLADADLRYGGDLDNPAAPVVTWNTVRNIAGAGATVLRMGNYIGYLKTGSNMGTLAIQWRQQTSGVGDSTLAEGSMLMLRKIF